MTHPRALQVTIRTPSNTAYEGEVLSLRVPTHTGQVGLRPKSEPAVLAVDAGLIVLKTDRGTKYAGTAGGLLHTDGKQVGLLSPLAVVGDDVASVTEQLNTLISTPHEEMEVRHALGRLESQILQELRHEAGADKSGP